MMIIVDRRSIEGHEGARAGNADSLRAHGAITILFPPMIRWPFLLEARLPKKRIKHQQKVRANRQRDAIRRRSRLPFVLITALTALASLALVVAGFLSYAPPR